MKTIQRTTKTLFAFLITIALLISVFLFSSQSIVVNAQSSNFSSTQVLSATQSENISFTSREVEDTATTNNVPLYTQHSSLENSCGATAGAIVIGFYDKYYEDLIPNYKGYLSKSGRYLTNDSVYIPALMQELYNLMRINVDDLGVSKDDCLNGLSTYVQNKGHTASFLSVKTSSYINESNYLSAIQSNNPVLLFNASTDIYIISNTSTSDTITKSTISANHVYVGYGYTKIKYYNDNGNFRTDTYLKVACGLSTMTTGYIKVASTTSNVSSTWLLYGYSVAIS